MFAPVNQVFLLLRHSCYKLSGSFVLLKLVPRQNAVKLRKLSNIMEPLCFNALLTQYFAQPHSCLLHFLKGRKNNGVGIGLFMQVRRQQQQ